MDHDTMISIRANMSGNIVANFNIYGALGIFLLFCNHQDTESKTREI